MAFRFLKQVGTATSNNLVVAVNDDYILDVEGVSACVGLLFFGGWGGGGRNVALNVVAQRHSLNLILRQKYKQKNVTKRHLLFKNSYKCPPVLTNILK